MTKPRKRIVLDSDDESSEVEGLDESCAQDNGQKSGIEDQDYSHAPNDDQPLLGTRSTSSSEKLRRDLQTAHSNLIDPTPSQHPLGSDEAAFDLPKKGSIKLVEPIDSPLQRMAPKNLSKPRTSKTDKDKHHSHGDDDQWAVPFSSPSGTPSRFHIEATDLDMDSQSTELETRPSKKRRITTLGTEDEIYGRSTQASVSGRIIPSADESAGPTIQLDESPYVESKKPDQTVESSTEAGLRRQQQMEPTVVVPRRRDISRQSESNNTRSNAEHPDAEGSEDELGSDEIAIGLPKERYAPRPSRSRANKDAEHDSQPALGETEMPLPKKAKRGRASDAYTSLDKENLVNLGFRSSQAAEALREASGNVERAAEALFSKTELNPEPEQYIEAVERMPGERDHEVQDSLMIQVTSERQDAPRVDKITETYSNDPTVAEPAESKQKKKKGRGRPRKTDVTEEKIVEVRVDPGENSAIVEQDAVRKKEDKLVLQEIESNAQPADGTDIQAHALHGVELTKDVEAQSHSQGQRPEQTIPEDKVSISPRKQSSIGSKISVPLKVGLSKRARIEPLLRIIRK